MSQAARALDSESDPERARPARLAPVAGQSIYSANLIFASVDLE